MDRAQAQFQATDATILRHWLPALLTRDAQRWLSMVSVHSYKEFRHRFLERFVSAHFLSDLEADLYRRTQASTEPLAQYVGVITDMVRTIRPTADPQEVLQHIIRGADPFFLHDLERLLPRTFDDIVRVADQLDARRKHIRYRQPPPHPRTMVNPDLGWHQVPHDHAKPQLASNQCSKCLKFGHWSRECRGTPHSRDSYQYHTYKGNQHYPGDRDHNRPHGNSQLGNEHVRSQGHSRPRSGNFPHLSSQTRDNRQSQTRDNHQFHKDSRAPTSQPFRGTCNACGQFGHKAFQCKTQRRQFSQNHAARVVEPDTAVTFHTYNSAQSASNGDGDSLQGN